MSTVGLPRDESERPLPDENWRSLAQLVTSCAEEQTRLYKRMAFVLHHPSPVGDVPLVLERGMECVRELARHRWPPFGCRR